MAERRMFAKTIVLSDAFLDIPMSARCLYFTLSMLADDDGFVNSPRSIMRQCGASEDDMRILFLKKFVLDIPDESGIVVIKHWRINNYLRSDRYTETKYLEAKSLLTTDENGTYHMNAGGIPHGIPMVSTGKDSIGKDSLVEVSIDEVDIVESSPAKEIIAYLNEVCGTNYKTGTKATLKHINARLSEGFTVDDFKSVIDKKHLEWGNDSKMSQYLRPETLFGTKFEAYLNQPTKQDSMIARWMNA